MAMRNVGYGPIGDISAGHERGRQLWRPSRRQVHGSVPSGADHSATSNIGDLTCDLYKSRDTYGNFLRLVRPTRSCRGRLVSVRRTHPSELVFGKSPGICGNFLRPAPLTCPCFRRHAAIPRIAHPLDRRTLGRLPVQTQWIGKRRRSELRKEQLLLRRRTHTCA